MPTVFLPTMPEEQVQRIVKRAMSTNRLLAAYTDVKTKPLTPSTIAQSLAVIVQEISLDYVLTQNKCLLDEEYAKNMGLPKHLQNKTLAYISRPSSLLNARRTGCFEMPPEYDFKQIRQHFSFTSFLPVSEVLRCITKVRLQSLNVATANLFVTPSSATRPDEFEQMQAFHREKTKAMLEDTWVSSLCQAVTSSLYNIGKGWFNLREHRMPVYLPSKLRKLMMQIKFVMQDSIKSLCDNSIESFERLIVSGLDFNVEVEAFDRVINVWRPQPELLPAAALGSRRYKDELQKMQDEAPEEDGENQQKAGGLFFIDITVSKTHVLGPSFGLERVETMPLEIYDDGVGVMKGVPELEPLILTSMFWPEKPFLVAPDKNDGGVKVRRERISWALKEARKQLEGYIAALEPLQAIITIDVAAVVREWESKKPEEIAAGLRNFQTKKDYMDEHIPRNIAVGGFTVGLERIKKLVIAKYTDMIAGLGGAIASSTRKRTEDAVKGFDSMLGILKKPPANVEAIQQMREYMLEIPALLIDLKAEVDSVTKDYDLLDGLLYEYKASDVKIRWHCYGLPHLIFSKIHEASKQLDERQADFNKAQMDEQADFNDDLAALSKIVNNFHTRKVEWQIGKGEDGDVVEATAVEVKRITKRLVDADALVKKFNSREILFGVPQTDYSDIQKTTKAFEPFASMWLAMFEFDRSRNIWRSDPFTKLDHEEIEKSVQAWWRTIFKVSKIFEATQPDVFAMVVQVKEDLESFKDNLPIITALRNPGMRDRHWKSLSAAIGMDLTFTDSVTLDTVLFDMKLPQYMQQIATSGDLASKEYMIEKTLSDMKESWNGVNLDLMEYRDSGTSALRGLDDMIQHLDDNIVMAQSLAFSPNQGPFAEEIEQWEKDLVMTQEMLDEWIACQRLWMYLEPIFGSEDIKKQLPSESKKFQSIDRNLRRMVDGVLKNPAAIDACTRGGQRTLDMLRDGNKVLDGVQKGLSDYLETKRAGFGRFYFLSNDELLEILSQTKEVCE
jgi:dynein heavy chain